MKKLLLLIFILKSINISYSQVGNSPYPIIFVHGINSDEQTWSVVVSYLSNSWSVSSNNIFQAVLNARGGDTTNYHQDVLILDYDVNLIRVNNLSSSNIYLVNFKNFWNRDENNPRIIINSDEGPGSFFTQSKSNESAILKQGYALKKCIEKVLNATGAEKVILVGHSMGGLAIREYLQRVENNSHIWWINPNETDGHKVAKVLTLDTPHLGSNVFAEYFAGVNPFSEAMRDLKFTYDLGIPAGYLFSNYEYNIPSFSFNNKDINCNGGENDFVNGLSSGTTFNSIYPLPTNVLYTWVVSKFTLSLTGDGCVDVDRQWLYNASGNSEPMNVSDTLMTNRPHSNIPGFEGITEDVNNIIRGLDEPDEISMAYKIKAGDYYSGFIAHKTKYNPVDNDVYKFSVNNRSNVAGIIKGVNAGQTNIYILSSTGQEVASKIISQISDTVYANFLQPGDYYLKISGNANNNPGYIHYSFKVLKTETEPNENLIFVQNQLVSDTSTFSFTCSGSNRVLILFLGDGLLSQTDGITYNGIPLIKEAEKTRTNYPLIIRSSFWYLSNPPVGTHNVIISNSSISSAIAICLNNCDINYPIDTYTTDQGYGYPPYYGNLGWHIETIHNSSFILMGLFSLANNETITHTLTSPDFLINSGEYVSSEYGGVFRTKNSVGFNQTDNYGSYGGNWWVQDFAGNARAFSVLVNVAVRTNNVTWEYPNGGEIFQSGTYHLIKWKQSQSISTVKLEYTIDNGNNWETIDSTIDASLGNYLWNVPNVNSNQVKIKITDIANNFHTDESNNVFTIAAPDYIPDNIFVINEQSADTSTFPFRCSGVDRVLAVVLGDGMIDVAGITYNSIPLTKGIEKINSYYGNASSSIWYLNNPPVGTYNLEISNPRVRGVIAICLNNCDINNPIDTFSTSDGYVPPYFGNLVWSITTKYDSSFVILGACSYANNETIIQSLSPPDFLISSKEYVSSVWSHGRSKISAGYSQTGLTGNYSGNWWIQDFAGNARGFSTLVNLAFKKRNSSRTIHLLVNALLQAQYDPILNRLNSNDSITAYLRNIYSPYSIIDSSKSLIDSNTFKGNFLFLNAISGDYYVVLKHRNSVETWSKSGGISFTQSDTAYFDFTFSQSQAYGNNLIQIGTKWCIYSGDVNQDGYIDLTDILLIFNDASNFSSGYLVTDLNGDTYTDLNDLLIAFNNSVKFIAKITP
jgi:pimeloyl-ACP methyl ester carboxylesterase